MKKNDLSLALAAIGLAVPLGLTAVLVTVAFALGVLIGPRLARWLKD